MRKLLLLATFAVFFTAGVVAQERSVTGSVTSSENGEDLPGVSVIEKGTTNGTVTDIDGQYKLTVSSGDAVLVFSFIGFESQEISVGNQSTINVSLSTDVTELAEVVVTGVAVGTETKKLGFALTKVDESLIQEVPALDASQALRGKVAGLRVYQNQGDDAAAVFLRGAKSIFGNIAPLILIDGILTNQGLGDINAEDIESIEVVKGAAASSLYGSRAAGGVIQIITKRSARGKEGIRVQVDNEFGISSVDTDGYPLSNKHPWRMRDGYAKDDSGNYPGSSIPYSYYDVVDPITGEVTVIGDSGFDRESGDRVYDTELDGRVLFDNDYPENYNLLGTALKDQTFQNNIVSVSGSRDSFTFYGSFQNQVRGGIADPIDPDTRRTARLNFGLYPTDKLEVRISTSYTNITESPVSRNGQGTFFADLMVTEPFINYLETDEEGDYLVNPAGFNIQVANIDNPFYFYNTVEYENQDERFVAGIELKYKLTDKIQAQFNQSIDKQFFKGSTYYPVGFKTKTPSSALNNGNYAVNENRSNYSTTSFQVNYADQFGDFRIGLSGKSLYEFQDFNNLGGSGRDLTTRGVKRLNITDQVTRGINSYQEETVTYNYFFTGMVDYADKIIIDGMIRQDGSSRFGSNNRWSTFYRGALAYRITEDFDIPNFQELKFRAAYGTAGRRPGWSWQYEVYAVSNSGISPVSPGNSDLRPSVNRELEIGLDGRVFDMVSFQLNYAVSNTKDDFINAPLSAALGRGNAVWSNLGNVKSSSLELELAADWINNSNLKWTTNLTIGRVRSEITDLGGIPAFVSGAYRIEEGAPTGTFYGNRLIESLDELAVDESGFVVAHNYAAGTYTPDDFVVNNAGFVVLESAIGSSTEYAVYEMDTDKGIPAQVQIGNNNPDALVGIANTLTFKNSLQLYFLLDWQIGGQRYNGSKQYLYFNWRHTDLEEFSDAGHHPEFAVSAFSLYNGNNYISYFVEDSDYLKVRELSLSYTLDGRLVNNIIEDAKISLIGRNLLTFTNYDGFDPEGTIEDFPYPIYRTISAKLSLRF